MILTGKTCYSRILYLMTCGELYEQAIEELSIKAPNFRHEGIAGYIETEYTIKIRNLKIFANVWESYWSLSEVKRLNLYGLAKGLGDRK